MKVFISQAMNGKTEEEIKKVREEIIKTLKLELKTFKVIETLFDFKDKSPIYYLGKSIEAMADADIVVFAEDWQDARGCNIEFDVANQYGKRIIFWRN